MYFITKLFNPEIYQGKYKKNKYFEGWYFKLVDDKQQNILSIIPGISEYLEKSHAFIQIINGTTGETHYIRYKMKDFIYSHKKFEI